MSIEIEPSPDTTEIIRRELRLNPALSNEQVIDGLLSAHGITVNARQVAQVRRGLKPKDDADRYSGEELQAAFTFIRRVGGIRRANALLSAFSALDEDI